MKIFKLFVVSLTLLVIAQANAQSDGELTHMPKWELYKQDGTLVSSDDFAGKPLILSFWGTWCPYCKKLQPGLDQLAKDYAPKGLEVLTISVGEEPGATPQTELENRGLSLQTVVDGDELATDVFAIPGTPATIFIAPDGRILGRTMSSIPDDPQWQQAADYLVGLIATE